MVRIISIVENDNDVIALIIKQVVQEQLTHGKKDEITIKIAK